MTLTHDDGHDDDRHDDVVVAALAELRETRRQRRLGDWHVIDAVYKAYVAAITGGIAVTILSGLVGDERITGGALADVRTSGPAVIGTVIALSIAFGLRAGGRGGPLALEAPEVRYVLLAPIDRDIALRQPAIRQLRFTSFAGAVTGAAVGLLAYRRFPGVPGEWVACGAAVGAAAAVAMTGAAMVAAGRRLRPIVASLIGAAVVAWSVGDVIAGSVTSPCSLLGELGIWPLGTRPAALAALPLPLVLAVVGVRMVGGTSLEASERRGRLVTHLRFAATMQDVRTVMLLRRQLASEVPRSRPWIRLRPARGGRITWRRDWRGILRWPAVRLARMAVLGIVAGLAVAAAWGGTTPLLVAAGVALFVAGLDAIEGLAQEVDHPHRQDAVPVLPGALHLHHLAAPTVVLTGVVLLGVGAAAAVTALAGGDVELVVRVGLPLAIPTAALAAGAAAVSTLRSPPDASRMMADSTGMALLFHHALPPALATAGPGAALLVRWQLETDPGRDAIGVAASMAVNVALLAALVLGWVRHRSGIAAAMSGGGLAAAGRQ